MDFTMEPMPGRLRVSDLLNEAGPLNDAGWPVVEPSQSDRRGDAVQNRYEVMQSVCNRRGPTIYNHLYRDCQTACHHHIGWVGADLTVMSTMGLWARAVLLHAIISYVTAQTVIINSLTPNVGSLAGGTR